MARRARHERLVADVELCAREPIGYGEGILDPLRTRAFAGSEEDVGLLLSRVRRYQ